MAGPVILSAADLAATMRVDVLRIESLVAMGMPTRSDGAFELSAVAEWLEDSGRGRRCNWHGTVRTLGEVAEAFGVHRDTVRKAWRAAGMPGRSGRYHLGEIATWFRERDESSPVGGSGSDELLKKRAAEARLREGQARRIERENRLAEEEICYRGDVERFLSQLFEFLRELHGRLEAEINPTLPREHADEISADIGARLASIQRTLHGWVRRLDEISQE